MLVHHLLSKFDFLPGDVLSWSVQECNDPWPDAARGHQQVKWEFPEMGVTPKSSTVGWDFP